MTLAIVDSVLLMSPATGRAIHVANICGGREYYFDLESTSPPDGRPDVDGHELHVVYRPTNAAGEGLEWRSPPQLAEPAPLVGPFLRLACRGRHVLRHSGSIALTGGVGLWRVSIYEGREDLEPHWHALNAYVGAGVPYRVPSFNTRAGAPASTTWTDAIGLSVTLDHNEIELAGLQTTLTNTAAQPRWLWTSWYG